MFKENQIWNHQDPPPLTIGTAKKKRERRTRKNISTKTKTRKRKKVKNMTKKGKENQPIHWLMR